MKAVREYGIPHRTLAIKFNRKRGDMAYKRPGMNPMMGEEVEKYFFQWDLFIQKHVLPVGRELLIQKSQYIHCLMYGSTSSVGSVGHGWCN